MNAIVLTLGLLALLLIAWGGLWLYAVVHEDLRCTSRAYPVDLSMSIGFWTHFARFNGWNKGGAE